MDILKSLLVYYEKADRKGMDDLMKNWAGEHGYDQLITDVLEPFLQEIGERWLNRGGSLAQAYIAGKVSEDILTMIAEERDGKIVSESKGPVIMGNIEDDFHPLGRSMVVTFLRVEGWNVCDLGNDVPADHFVDKALEIGAKVIGVSAMMYSTANNIRSLREEIDKRGMKGKIKLAVGGAVFVLNPELVGEVGGEGTARNALAAPALFSRLWEEAERKENRP